MSILGAFEIRTNPWIAPHLIVMEDAHGNVVRVFDTTDYRKQFFHLLNMTPPKSE